jgi:hypothetical protein
MNGTLLDNVVTAGRLETFVGGCARARGSACAVPSDEMLSMWRLVRGCINDVAVKVGVAPNLATRSQCGLQAACRSLGFPVGRGHQW